MGAPDQRTWYLSGPGPLQPPPPCPNQRAALAGLHGAPPGAMAPPDQGLAGPDPACPFGAIEPPARLSSQAADRLGPPGRTATVSLAARSPDHFYRGQQLRRPRTGSCHYATCNAHQPAAVGCKPVCTARETNIAHDGAARAKRPSAAKAQDPAVQPG